MLLTCEPNEIHPIQPQYILNYAALSLGITNYSLYNAFTGLLRPTFGGKGRIRPFGVITVHSISFALGKITLGQNIFQSESISGGQNTFNINPL